MAKEITVTIKLDDNIPARAKTIEALLKRIHDLPQADQERIIAICENPKALKGLADNWQLLQGMFS